MKKLRGAFKIRRGGQEKPGKACGKHAEALSLPRSFFHQKRSAILKFTQTLSQFPRSPSLTPPLSRWHGAHLVGHGLEEDGRGRDFLLVGHEAVGEMTPIRQIQAHNSPVGLNQGGVHGEVCGGPWNKGTQRGPTPSHVQTLVGLVKIALLCPYGLPPRGILQSELAKYLNRAGR